MRYFAITDDAGTVERIFAYGAGREWRLDGDSWVELKGAPVFRWLLKGRVDLDDYYPAPGELPPVPHELASA